MPNIIQPIITMNGLNSIMSKGDKEWSLSLPDLTHIEIGDGKEKLDVESTNLTHKLARVSLEKNKQNNGYHHIVVVKDTDFDEEVRVPCHIHEIGYFIGTLLFAVYSSPKIICEKNSQMDLILTFDLELAKEQIFGTITKFEGIEEETKTRCSTSTLDLNNGDLVYITHADRKTDNIFDSYQGTIVPIQETRYAGTYKVFNCKVNSFDINEKFTGTTTATWKTNKFTFSVPENIPISENKKPLLTGANIVKIHTQEEFDKIFNKGIDTSIPENITLILSPPPDIRAKSHKSFSINEKNNPPAYLLKNNIRIFSNTQVIGFNINTTLVSKVSDDLHIIIEGTKDKPIKGVEMYGWSFNGETCSDKTQSKIDGVNDLVQNGGAFYLDHVEDCYLNCKIINHSSKGYGGGIFGTENAKYITANNICYNQASKGNGVFGCTKSTFTLINSNAASDKREPLNIVFTDNRNISVYIEVVENTSTDPLVNTSMTQEEITEIKNTILTKDDCFKASQYKGGIAKITTKERFKNSENNTDLSSNEILYELIANLGLDLI